MSRVIHTESAGKDRTQLSRDILRALHQLMRQSKVDEQTRDLAAFISLALDDIAKTIDASVTAWEKRGYWLKADRFRLEWEWAERLGRKMRDALMSDDWDSVALTSAQVAEKLKGIQLPKREPNTIPWNGSWEKLQLSNRPQR